MEEMVLQEGEEEEGEPPLRGGKECDGGDGVTGGGRERGWEEEGEMGRGGATSVVLLNAVSVQTGSVSSFNCTVTGSGPDPASVVWSIRDTSGNLLSSASLFTTQLFGTADSTDGSVISQGTFTVTQSHLGQRLFCTVTDQGSSSTTSIYTVITATNQANLGQTCSAAISCSPANSRCSNNICVCSTGYTVNGNTCNQKKQLGSSCPVGNSQACAPSDSQCSSFQPYVCECQNGYVQSGSTCVLSQAGLGESCTNPSRTCSVSDSTCTFGTCQCSNGFVSSGSTCITSTAGLGDSCSNPSRSCTVLNTVCDPFSGYTCQCTGNYVQFGNQCIANYVGLNQACTNPSRTCSVTNSICGSSGLCVCGSGYVQSGSSCITSTVGLNEECENPNRTCSVTNSECGSSGFCVCGSGYVQSGPSCVISNVNLGDSCVNPTLTCSVPNSSCGVSGTCTCSQGYTQSGSTCVSNSAGLGESCTSPTRTCVDANTECNATNGTCDCESGYVSNSVTCISESAVAGQACVSSVGCVATGSVNPSCVNNVCECPNNFFIFNAGCNASPANTQNPFTVNGASNFPSTYVGATCYEVNLHESTQMVCEDAKGQPLSAAGWYHMPSFTAVSISTGGFINGDISNTDLTVSNALSNYTGDYMCRLCYSSSRCTNSTTVQLRVLGTEIQSSTLSVSPSGTITKGSTVTLTCSTSPTGVASTYIFYKDSTVIQSTTQSTFQIQNVQTTHIGSYRCNASNTTQTVTHNFDDGDLVITCSGFSANPAISAYTFYNEAGSQLASSASASYTVNSTQGYQIYYCRATNSLGTSNEQYIDVQEPGTEPGVGASTENTGLGTGTIAAIVLGIIFLLLLIIIIIVCCCSYGWCRKKEKVEPEIHIVSQPPVKPYIPSVSTEEYEPYVASPRYYLKPATSTGPIISMFDDSYEQPRAHQLPALDTQYLYSDDHKPRHKKKRRKHRRSHREPSPRRDVYAEVTPPSDEDLVVVPGKQNYMEADA
ncbi:hypothetical protein MAR_020322 [Mya arenaria]|uniref:Ig-like domain-containing protein n=1 Tax=Mya arenaria TaxID=6604 RepID=A0ABY7E4L8_MYAAR|nr:hypothetical protein MAR_020322 [Mya arenaria]